MQKIFSKKITLLKFIKDKSSLLIQNNQIMENLQKLKKKKKFAYTSPPEHLHVMGDPAVALRKRKILEMHTIYQLQFLFCMTIHSNLKYILIRGRSNFKQSF